MQCLHSAWGKDHPSLWRELHQWYSSRTCHFFVLPTPLGNDHSFGGDSVCPSYMFNKSESLPSPSIGITKWPPSGVCGCVVWNGTSPYWWLLVILAGGFGIDCFEALVVSFGVWSSPPLLWFWDNLGCITKLSSFGDCYSHRVDTMYWFFACLLLQDISPLWLLWFSIWFPL